MMKLYYTIGIIFLLSLGLELYHHLKLNKYKNELKRSKNNIKKNTRHYLGAIKDGSQYRSLDDIAIPEDFKRTMVKINQTYQLRNIKFISLKKRRGNNLG